MTKPILHLVAGPTASGKTAAALELARHNPSVIINADAMQVYRDLPLLTAQPELREKAAHKHVLFEILDAGERCSAGLWLSLAEKEIEKARAEKLTPILVGGTGLYFRALLQGLAEIPPIPEALRAKTARLYEELGHDAFRAELAKKDPESAVSIKTNDRQRLVRAYEVALHTNRTIGEWQKEKPSRPQGDWCEIFTLRPHLLLPERADLYARCDARFLTMMDNGALDEVRNLVARNLDADLPAMKILGVRELAAHLRGELSLDEAVAKAQQATRNYAKRQVTWFKNQGFGATLSAS